MFVQPGAVKELLDIGGVPYKQNSISYILSCPRCSKKQKLYIRKKDGRFVCFVCREADGFQGKPEFVFSELLGVPLADLRFKLYGEKNEGAELFLDLQLKDFFGESDELPFFAEQEHLEVEPDPDFRPLDHRASQAGVKYLESRGISLEIAKEYGIMYHPPKQRVIFPIRSGGRLLGWQSRLIDLYDYEGNRIESREPKALTSTGLKRDRILMFSDSLKDSEHAVLCEGPTDALKAHMVGGNVASLGKAVSDTQLNMIRNSGIRKLYLALDPDAFVESKKILEKVSQDMEVYDMRPPRPYKDLGEMPMSEVKELFQKATRIDRNFLFLYLNPAIVGGR